MTKFVSNGSTICKTLQANQGYNWKRKGFARYFEKEKHRILLGEKGGQCMSRIKKKACPVQRRVLLELLENIIAAQFEAEAAEKPV